MSTELHPAESCPYCGGTRGVQPISGISPTVRAWSCADCGTDWAISVVNPHLRCAPLAELAAAAGDLERLQGTLRQVLALAEAAPTLAEAQLRHQLAGHPA